MILRSESGNRRRSDTDSEKNRQMKIGLWETFVEGFLSLLDRPITFEEFLSSNSRYFDKLMVEAAQKEQLFAVGGKFVLSLQSDAAKESVPDYFSAKMEADHKISASRQIQITADLYFQNHQKDWNKDETWDCSALKS